MMCPPDYFSFQKPDSDIPSPNVFVEQGRKIYWDNPYIFHKQAVRQWENFVHVLQNETNARLAFIPPNEGHNTQVFTADPSLTITRNGQTHGFLSRFTNDRRDVEIDAHIAALIEMFPDIEFTKAEYETEGTGDNVYDPYRRVFWSGYADTSTDDPQSGRSDKHAHAQLADLAGVPVHSLHVQKPFFHIDTTLAPLSHGHILFYEGGVDAESQKAFYKAAFEDSGLAKDDYLIPVSQDDAMKFGCNVVNIDDAVILPECSPALQEAIRAKGYRVFTVNLDRFLLSGGGPHCMVNRLDYRL